MTEGTPIVVVGGPWPERIGAHGIIAYRQGCRTYPWAGCARDEVIILLDHDPLTDGRVSPDGGGWTCAIGVNDVRKRGAA
jgi:hypothetical protein